MLIEQAGRVFASGLGDQGSVPGCVISSSSSSSCHATITDIPDPLSPLLPIIHRFWQVFRATYKRLKKWYMCCIL